MTGAVVEAMLHDVERSCEFKLCNLDIEKSDFYEVAYVMF
jgi:hypothetical protein